MSKMLSRNIHACASWIIINPARLRTIVFIVLLVLALLVLVAPTTLAFAGDAIGGSHSAG
jgi:hypothetical protein